MLPSREAPPQNLRSASLPSSAIWAKDPVSEAPHGSDAPMRRIPSCGTILHGMGSAPVTARENASLGKRARRAPGRFASLGDTPSASRNARVNAVGESYP